MINSTAWQLYGGANDDLLQQGLCHMLHDPGLLQSEPLPPQRPWLTHASTGDTWTLKSRFGTVSVGSLGPGAHKIWFEPSEHLWQILGLILNMVSPLLPSCWGVSFALGNGVSPQSRSSAANLWLQHRATAIPATYHQRHHVGCWQRSVQSKLCFFQSWNRWMDVSLVWMWELDNKEDWEPKNWSFWTVVLEKAPEYLGEQGGQPVSPKRNQP